MSKRVWRLGLIGWPLEHSFSPRLQQAALKDTGLSGEYRLLPVPPQNADEDLNRLLGELRSGALDGLNVTIPHKRSVLSYLDQKSYAATSIGAVNTIVYRNGRLVGENTDAPGFMADLEGLVEGNAKKAVILGAGGAARAAGFGLLSAGWDVTFLARRPDQADAAARYLGESVVSKNGSGVGAGSITASALDRSSLDAACVGRVLIVNATPLGMYPETGRSPWPEDYPFPPQSAVYDLVYNPPRTKLIRDARAAGLPARGGIGMLVEQAALAFELWTGVRPSRDAMLATVIR